MKSASILLPGTKDFPLTIAGDESVLRTVVVFETTIVGRVTAVPLTALHTRADVLRGEEVARAALVVEDVTIVLVAAAQ